jgi:hypothetical protein
MHGRVGSTLKICTCAGSVGGNVCVVPEGVVTVGTVAHPVNPAISKAAPNHPKFRKIVFMLRIVFSEPALSAKKSGRS